MDIDNFSWYVSEVKQQLENAKYYLRFLAQDTDNPQLLAEHAQTINQIEISLDEEEGRLRTEIENKKTDEEREKEALMQAVRKAYYEETGEHLLLSTSDMMKALHEEHEKIKTAQRTYDAPETPWGDFLSQPQSKKAWAKSIKERFSKFSRGKRD